MCSTCIPHGDAICSLNKLSEEDLRELNSNQDYSKLAYLGGKD